MITGTMVKFLVGFSLMLIVKASNAEMKYSYFDDFLSSLDEEQQAIITGDVKPFEGSGDELTQEMQETKFSLPLRTGLTGSKDVSCCSLGQLAGDKGYHCYSRFYAARILLRNQNRAHNRKMGFHGRDSVPNYGTKLMRTFEQCVATRGKVFYKCCHLAAEERKSRPHFDSIQRKRYELKMRKIKMPTQVQLNDDLSPQPQLNDDLSPQPQQNDNFINA